MKNVLFFGIFNPEYARTRVLTEGFTELGYEIISCQVDPRASHGLSKYLALWKQGRALRRKDFDYIFVLFPGHTVVWLARILFGNRIIFDAFVSLYDSNVHDRALYTQYSFKALRDRLFDYLSCALAHTVLVDTEAHKKYFVEHIDVSVDKIIVVPVGASNAWFTAYKTHRTLAHDFTQVSFYGSYIPLHGVSIIVRAAHLLSAESFRFRIIGSGQEYVNVQKLIKKLDDASNIEFLQHMPRRELIKYMNMSDICLGIFGDTKKAMRVVPNKVYECAALGKPIITADTQGIRESFTDKENIFLCESSSPGALAHALRVLANNKKDMMRLGVVAYKHMQKYYTPKHIVNNLLEALSK